MGCNRIFGSKRAALHYTKYTKTCTAKLAKMFRPKTVTYSAENVDRSLTNKLRNRYVATPKNAVGVFDLVQ